MKNQINMKISYGICVHNELREITSLIPYLLENKRHEDEIVIVFDSQNGTDEVWNYLLEIKDDKHIFVSKFDFRGDFSAIKNVLKNSSNGDYAFNIDPDEIPNIALLHSLPTILEANPSVEAFWVQRINIVNGITDEYIKEQNWIKSPEGWINWPYDSQLRVFKLKPEIYWSGKVHEKIIGYQTVGRLPDIMEYSLWHEKDFDRQVKQNNLYAELLLPNP